MFDPNGLLFAGMIEIRAAKVLFHSGQNSHIKFAMVAPYLSRAGKMKWLLEVGIFAASILAGLFLVDLVPMRSLSRSWRLQLPPCLLELALHLRLLGFPAECTRRND
jgi:hypothetical protein